MNSLRRAGKIGGVLGADGTPPGNSQAERPSHGSNLDTTRGRASTEGEPGQTVGRALRVPSQIGAALIILFTGKANGGDGNDRRGYTRGRTRWLPGIRCAGVTSQNQVMSFDPSWPREELTQLLPNGTLFHDIRIQVGADALTASIEMLTAVRASGG